MSDHTKYIPEQDPTPPGIPQRPPQEPPKTLLSLWAHPNPALYYQRQSLDASLPLYPLPTGHPAAPRK